MRRLNTYVKLGTPFAALLLFSSLSCIKCKAQDSIAINFTISFPENTTLTTTQRQELTTKVESIIARTNSSGGNDSPFVIVPTLTVTGEQTTESAIVTVTLVEGELQLIVKNKHDGTIYNELTTTLQATRRQNDTTDGATLLIRAVNTRDSRFVRFIRTTKKRIAERYADCAIELPQTQ